PAWRSRRFSGATPPSPSSTRRPAPSVTIRVLNLGSRSPSNQMATRVGAVRTAAPTRGSARSGNAWARAVAGRRTTRAASQTRIEAPRRTASGRRAGFSVIVWPTSDPGGASLGWGRQDARAGSPTPGSPGRSRGIVVPLGCEEGPGGEPESDHAARDEQPAEAGPAYR